MKTINSLRSKLLVITLALMASVSSFAYDEMPDFQVDGLYYNFLEGDNVEVTHPYRPEMPTEGTSTTATQDLYDDYAELTELTIPSTISYEGKVYNVIRIGYAAFDQCNLTYVDIPSSIKTIGVGAFSNCSSLTSITLKEGLEHIEGNAFADCRLLETITFPNSLKTVGSYAFSFTAWYNNQPNGGVYAGNVFYKYKGDIPENTSFVIKEGTVSISPDAFIKENRRIDYGLVAVAIPNSVEIIGEYAFSQCRALRSVNIPSRVTTIESYAFSYCKSLTSVTSEIVEPLSLPSDVFFKASVANATLYVPAESVEAYKNADQWKDFGQILPIKPTSYKSQWCDTWNVFVENGSVYPPHEETYRYQLAKDTVIGEHTYTAVVSKAINDAFDAPRYVAAVRFTDDRKVYIYYDNAEYLLYDFNVQEGDELEVFAGINNYTSEIKTYKCTVTGVEQYACVGCPATITLEVHNHPDDFREFYRQTQWIEGVGDINGFLNGINGYINIPGNAAEYLLCAYQGDELKYTGDLYEEYGCGDDAEQTPEDLFPTLWGLQRTDVELHTTGDDEAYRSAFNEYVPTLVNGKWYLYDGRNYLREENNQVLLYAPDVEIYEDIVLYDWTLEVGDTLPYHNKSVYRKSDYIVTDVSTITLLDGKEYKKWTLACGYEYIESIGAINGHGYGLFLCLPHYGHWATYIHTSLVCASRNNQLLYQMDEAEMERLGAECLCEVETSYKSQWCNTWNVFMHSGGARLDSEETWQYKLDRDTIINGKLYSTVIYYLTSDPSREYYMGAVRFGDDRKVYRAIGNSESVVYDFTAQVGDTLGPGVVYDVEVDSLTNLKTIYFHPYDRYEDKYIEYATVKWIEGVGSTDGFLLAKDYGTVGGASFYLLCAYRDDELKYAANKDLGCRYNAGEVTHDHFPTLAGLSRTIHEERSTNDTTRRDYFTKVVLDLKFPTLYHSQMYLRERDNKIFVVSRTYKNLTELYEYVLYDFTLEVGDSLPMLYIDYSSRGNWGPTYPLSILNVVNYRKEADGTIYPGDTLIVTEVSTITLLDGKEYKKWTFNNGMEYAEGIGSLSGDFYELIANKRTTEDLTASQLVCASKNGQLLYKMDDAEMERLGVECLCEYNSGPKKDNAKNGKIGGRPTPTQWNMLEVETKEMDGTPTILRAETFSYTLENDSIVANNKTYYQLARQSTKDTAITKSFVGALHFGEDEDNRVYFLRDGVEYVLYDFTAEIGDTVEIFAGINNYPQETTYTHVVVDKDTTEDGACRMFLEVVFLDETNATAENAEKVWLAGLGSVDGIVHNAAKRTSNAHAAPSRSASSRETESSVMLCAWREDSCLYTTNHPDYDAFGCVYNQDPTAVENLTSPSSYQKIIHEGTLLILHEGKVYNVIGIQIK